MYVTGIPTDNDLATVVAQLVAMDLVTELAAALKVSPETLYRWARPPGAEGRPKKFHPRTREALLVLFDDLGLLDRPDVKTYRAAAAELRRRATRPATPREETAQGGVESKEMVPRGIPPGETKTG